MKATDALLEQILLELRQIRQFVESQVDDRRPAPADMAELLREVRRASEDLPFTVSDLTLNATLKVGDDPALYNAISAVLGCFNTKRLGALFASIEGQAFDDLTVQRNGSKGRDGVSWRVVTSQNHKSSH